MTHPPPIFYKLTDQYGYSGKRYNPVQWGPDVTHTASGEGDMPGDGWIHVYAHPLQAAFFNTLHARFDLSRALLWECQCAGERADQPGIKHGFSSVTTIRTVPIPKVPLAAAVRCGIEAAHQVQINYLFRLWSYWATHWLDGSDRSISSACPSVCHPQRDTSKSATDAALVYATTLTLPRLSGDSREVSEAGIRENAALAVALSMAPSQTLIGPPIDTLSLIEKAMAEEDALEQKLSKQ